MIEMMPRARQDEPIMFFDPPRLETSGSPEALENPSYRERRVLELLPHGLGGEHPRTLDEIGRTFNVTRQRIRQIESQSVKKLNGLAETQKLRDVA